MKKATRLNLNPLDQRDLPAIFAAVSALTPVVGEGAAGALTTVQAEITLTNPANKTVKIGYGTVGANSSNPFTATSGSDYYFKTGYVEFLPGETRKTVPFQVRGDSTFESDETFGVDISHIPPQNLSDPLYPTIQVSQARATFTIRNDDAAPLAFGATGEVSQLEGNAGSSNTIVALVTLNRASATIVRVNYTTLAGTANSTDYQPVSGTLTFLPGETSKQILVPIKGDNTVEPNESFFINLSNPVGGSIGVGQAKFTILNDDVPPPPPQRFTHMVTSRANANGGISWTAARPGQAPMNLPNFGLAGDTTVMGDWNGDGKSDLGVARPNAATGLLDWYLDLNGDGYLAEQTVSFGFATDTPLVGDFNGDGRSDLVAVRKNAQTGLQGWFVDLERNGYTGEVAKNYGWNTDQPIVGDWNRDGYADMGVTRNVNGTRQWLLDKTNGADTAAEEVFLLGAWSDQAITGDWNNDGFADIGLVRAGTDGKLNWFFDTNNDRDVDIAYAYGTVGDRVLTGRF
jgi:Calx-beta domain